MHQQPQEGNRFVSIITRMCKSKKAATAVQPQTPKSRRSSTSRASKSASSSSDFTTLNFAGYNSNNYSNASSLSSQPSLSNLKDQLSPDNLHVYGFSEIRAATGNFSRDRFSSSSTSSSWRCSVRGKDVVIFQRKLRREMDLPLLRERLAAVCKIHHKSIIKLLGASISGNSVFLVYEYVKGANLADCLRNKVNPSFTLLSSWLSRMQIALGIAHGLDYIHNCTDTNSVHNHIKSSSIVVTEDSLEARICHFGTADLCGEVVEESKELPEIQTIDDRKLKKIGSKKMKIEGTRGYMSPEFIASGIATQKSDVYAFGVVILELLSGQEALKYEFDEAGDGVCKRVSIIDRAAEAINGGQLRSWIDKRLKDSYPVEIAQKMVHLGLDCVEDDPSQRPDMGIVVGLIQKLFLDSEDWRQRFALPVDATFGDISVSMTAR